MITLRPVAREDKNRLQRWRNRREIRQWMFTDHIISEQEHATWFDKLIESASSKSWIIQSGVHPIGFAQIGLCSTEGKEGTLGIYLAEMGGHGVGKIALGQVFDEVFRNGFCTLIFAEALESNTAALGLYRSMGMREIARHKSKVIKDGVAIDSIEFQIRSVDWTQISGQIYE